jgi:hypothetical protein
MSNTAIFDEPTCTAVIDSSVAGWVQQPYNRPGEWLLPGLVFDRWPIWTWTGEVLFEPTWCSRRSVQDDRRAGPITNLKKLWQRLFASTMDLKQHMESHLGDGIRLPLSQVIRRSDRIGHEAQKTSSENGGDDD